MVSLTDAVRAVSDPAVRQRPDPGGHRDAQCAGDQRGARVRGGALRDGFPVNVLNTLKQVSEVCLIFCATANPVEVVVAETERGRGILGVVDGVPPVGGETVDDEADRKALLRRIGYKL
jgi:hypothetical protein